MTFFSFAKNRHSLSTLLFGYTLLTNLLLSQCNPPHLSTLESPKTHSSAFLEKLNTDSTDQSVTQLEDKNPSHFQLNCADERSLQETILNLNALVDKVYTGNNKGSTVLKIDIKESTPECKRVFLSTLKDLNSKYGQNSFFDSEQQGDTQFIITIDTIKEPNHAGISSVENSRFDIKKIEVMRQGIEGGDIAVILVILVVIVLGGVGGLVYMRKRKEKKSAQKKQLKVDKQKFIPRLQMSSHAPFNGQKDIMTGEAFGKKTSSTNKKTKNLEVPKILSPSHKTTHALKLEDNHHSSIINDNIFTNLDNSPRSIDDDEDIQSVKNTPKDIGFNIEFSMIEQDSKIKSARDNDHE